MQDGSVREIRFHGAEEARMERNVSIVRSDLAYAAGLRIPLVTAR